MITRKQLRPLVGSVALLGLFSGPWASSALAVAYTVVPSGTGAPLDWNTDATWTSAGGTFPGAGAGDTATVSGDFGGVSQVVNISATPANGITALTLGDTNATPGATTIGSTGGNLFLSGATITSGGTAGAINTISAPISLSGNLTFGVGTNALTLTGAISPTAAGSRTIENASTQTVTLGALNLSSGEGASTVTIRTGNSAGDATSQTIFDGVIADGGSTAANIIVGGRRTGAVFQFNAANTYTGNTTIGIQANQVVLYRINTDQAFGAADTGNLVIGSGASGSAMQTFEAVGQDRVIAKNTTTINRNIGFQGDHSLAFQANTLTTSNNFTFTNNITAAGKTVTLGTAGGTMYLNNNNSDLLRTRDFTGAGTTILASDIVENSGTAATAQSRMVVKNSGTGALVITGTDGHQGGIRITNTGEVRVGDGGTTGAYVSGNGVVPVVSGTAGGTLAYDRSDDVTSAVIATGALNVAQRGSGSLTLTNSQFNWGNNSVGDGSSASTLVVTGDRVAESSTTANAAIVSTTTYRTVTLGGSDTVASLGIQVGQAVWVSGGSASAASYVDSITGANTFTVWGETLLTATPSMLTFGDGSALGTGASVTTVNNLATLAGDGDIAGTVNALAGSHLSAGVNLGDAGTLTIGTLTATGAHFDFDLAATAAGTSDLIAVGAGGFTFSDLTFAFDAITAGTVELGAAYDLISGLGVITGDVNLIDTDFGTGLDGLVATYTLADEAGVNYLRVTFAAIPEPSSFGLLVGVAALGGCLARRRHQARG